MIPQTTLRKPHRLCTSIKCRPIQGPWSQLYNPPLTGHLGHRTTNPPNQSIRPAANRLHEWPIQITAHLLQKLHWSQHWPSLLPSWPENIIELWNFHWCLHLPYANPIRTGKILLSSFFNWWNPNFSRLQSSTFVIEDLWRVLLRSGFEMKLYKCIIKFNLSSKTIWRLVMRKTQTRLKFISNAATKAYSKVKRKDYNFVIS